jgi:hypothetical protein
VRLQKQNDYVGCPMETNQSVSTGAMGGWGQGSCLHEAYPKYVSEWAGN